MSDRTTVSALLVLVAVVLSLWGWQANEAVMRHAAEERELREQLEKCRRLHSRAPVAPPAPLPDCAVDLAGRGREVVSECVSQWENALGIARRCADALDVCRRSCR